MIQSSRNGLSILITKYILKKKTFEDVGNKEISIKKI